MVAAFLAHPDVVGRSLAHIPQTNETGRAQPLRGALARVSAAHGLPIRLHKLAAAAGLNLRADAMPWAHVPMSTPVTTPSGPGVTCGHWTSTRPRTGSPWRPTCGAMTCRASSAFGRRSRWPMGSRRP